ncbi:N-acetyltransferase domain-containing protein [Plasmodiophora brassicae]|uniref:N-acetyltransferase domain-containing protein n=1 Tax=Plasmodiophora brassicae TaxID=37360 RepID=A0A3P3YM67_PLABS|nr:unnamed protein product [Plasmodiophora brassicae]
MAVGVRRSARRVPLAPGVDDDDNDDTDSAIVVKRDAAARKRRRVSFADDDDDNASDDDDNASDDDDDASSDSSADENENDNETSTGDVVQQQQPPEVDGDVLAVADAGRDVLAEATVLSSATIDEMQSAIMARAVHDISERALYEVRQARAPQAPAVHCWCCNGVAEPPATPLPAGRSLPLFVVSASPEWLLPAMYCSNVACSGRNLGCDATPRYGEGMTMENAGVLIALHYRGRWLPLDAFLKRGGTGDAITEVNSGLTIDRIGLAVLFRVMKPYDDFVEEVTVAATKKAAADDRDDDDDDENVNDENAAAAACIDKVEEDTRRPMPVEDLDGSARLVWVDDRAVGFSTYSVRMDRQYGVFAVLTGIYVRREHRRHGHGRALVRDFFRQVGPSISRDRVMAVQAPLTRLMLAVMISALSLEELSRIKVVRPHLPMQLAVSVKNWVSLNKGLPPITRHLFASQKGAAGQQQQQQQQTPLQVISAAGDTR